MLEKQFNPNFLYNGIVHFYIDKKGYSKEKANSIAQIIVKRERKSKTIAGLVKTKKKKLFIPST